MTKMFTSPLRRVMLVLISLYCFTPSQAQLINSYTFSQSTTGAYAPISGGTVLASGASLADQRYSVSLPFTFLMDNGSYTDIKVGVNGYISFGTADPGTGYWLLQSTSTGFAVASGFDANLAGLNSTTELRYQILGSAPNRVFVAQWQNFGYPSTTVLNVNFQIRLSETSNNIEYSYGTCTLGGSSSSISVQVGLRGTNNSIFHARSSTTSSWTSTTSSSVNTGNIVYQTSLNPPSGLSFLFTPPPPCTAPAQATALVLNPGQTSIGGTITAGTPAAAKHLVIRTPGNTSFNSTPVNGTVYAAGNPLGNGTIVYAGSSLTFSGGGLTQNTTYTYTVFGYNEGNCMGGPAYNTASPVTASATTTGPRTYQWAPIGNTDYNTAANWIPARTYTYNTDTLLFNTPGSWTVTNIPQEYLAGITITNGSNVTFNSAGTNTITLSQFLNISPGASLTLNGPNAMTIAFSSSGSPTGLVAGTVNVQGTCVFDTKYSSLLFAAGSAYNHQRNGGLIPYANYDPASTITVTNVTTTLPTILHTVNGYNYNQTFGNFTWDCSGQTAILTLNNVDSFRGNLSIISTGTGTLKINSTTAANAASSTTVSGNFTQNGGIVQFMVNSVYKVKGHVSILGGTMNGVGTMRVSGNFTKASAAMVVGTATSSPINFFFEGNYNQALSVSGAMGQFLNFTLNNPAGATLTGTLPVTGMVEIVQGALTGSGSVSYTGFVSILKYTLGSGNYSTGLEWPAVNPPNSVYANLTGTAPANRLSLTGSRTTSNLYLYNGVVCLNNYDLTCGNLTVGTSTAFPPNANRMVATNGTGFFKRNIPSSPSGTFLFPVGDITGVPEYSPCTIVSNSSSVNRVLGVRVVDAAHPSMASQTNYISRYWKTDDNVPATPITYLASFTYTPADVVGIEDINLNSWNASSWSELPTTVNNYTLTMFSTASNSMVSTNAIPLNGIEFTGWTKAHSVYHWTGAVGRNYTHAANWSPARTNPLNTDVLMFDNGGNDTVSTIVVNHISRLVVTNNTQVAFKLGESVTADEGLILNSDYDTATIELQIDPNSSIVTYKDLFDTDFWLSFTGQGNRALIQGKVEVENTYFLAYRGISFANCKGVVTPSGLLLAKGTSGGSTTQPPFVGTDSTLTMYGTYQLNYVSGNGWVPTAKWEPGSNILLTGTTTVTAPPAGIGTQQFQDVTYNCVNQTSNTNWGTSMPIIKGTLSVLSTGSGQWQWNDTTDINNYVQTGGTVDVRNGANQVLREITVRGNFNQTGGTFLSSATGTSSVIMHFAGTTGIQNVNFYNVAPAGPITYRIVNPNGINLTGTGTLTSAFPINTGGGVTISTTATNPINTTLGLQYAPTATLKYDAQGNIQADGMSFPATAGPANVQINIGSGNVLTLPGNRTVGNSLTMTSGDINIGAYDLTLGTSATNAGTLNWTDGNMRTAGGTFTRWYGTSGLPTAPGTNVGFYPLAQNFSRRHTSIYFSGSTALSSGGTISVGHSHTNGFTTGLNFTDGGYTVNTRTNSSWGFSSGNGIALTGTMGFTVTGADLFTTPNPVNLRMVLANSVVGTHVSGGGSYPNITAQRSGLSIADLTTAPFYIGSGAGNMGTVWTSITTGDWSNPATWDQGTVPPSNAIALISNNTVVTVNSSALVKMVNVQPASTLVMASGTLAVDSIINNSGVFHVNGGTATMGPAGGGFRTFTSSGTLTVTAGVLNVNGALSIISGAFNQSGGDINVDGTSPSGSVSNASHVWIATPAINVTGGTLKIVDPHGSSSSYAVFSAGFGNTTAAFGPGHTTIIGDGTSTQAGGSSAGFLLALANSTTGYGLTLGNLVINGSPAGSNRVVRLLEDLFVSGNITINQYGELSQLFSGNAKAIHLKGNLTVNAGGTLTSYAPVRFENWQANNSTVVSLPLSSPQTVSGNGVFRTSTSGTPANNELYDVYINNTADVTFNIGDFNSTVHFIKGRLNTSGFSMLPGSTVVNASQSTGWVNGKYQISLYNLGLEEAPIGDQNYYTPVYVSLSWFPYFPTTLKFGVTNGDHPAIGTSGLIPAKTVNRYYTVDTVGNVGFSPNSTSFRFRWNLANMDAGTTHQNLISTVFRSNSWVSTSVVSTSDTAIEMANLGNYYGAYQVGEPANSPVITSHPSAAAACTGTNAIFNVTAGWASGYQWEQATSGSNWTYIQNNTQFAGATTPQLTVIGVTPAMNGYQYRCKAYNGFDTTTSNAATLTVGTAVAPTIVITANPGTTICAGTAVTFTASTTNGGLTPGFQWKVNGTATGTNSSTYTSSTLSGGDVVTCELTSSSSCATPTTAVSNALTMTVNSTSPSSVSISANPGNSICSGTAVSFTAVPVNGGATPIYQWKKNGTNVGTNSTNYTDYALQNNDVITCVMVSSATCPATTTATSNAITMAVAPIVMPGVSIAANPGTTICANTSVTFTATPVNGGAAPVYQWKKNGVNVGTNAATYTTNTLISSDIISCELTSSANCLGATTATSNNLTMVVNPQPVPAVSISVTPGNSFCAGSAASFTATPTNGGTSPSYQWKKNGINVGTNSTTYNSSSLANGDVITCVLTSNAGCASPTTATSNAITVTVSPLVTPSVSITANPGNAICSGTSVTFTATPVNGGTTPAYQWKKNGVNAGTNNNTYTDNALVNGDVITCTLTSNESCITTATANSNSISISVSQPVAPAVTINASPGASVCAGSTITFTATPANGGSTPTYQWKVNGTNTGTNSSNFATSTLANGDIVTCDLVTSLTCVTQAGASSNSITVTITPTVTPSVSITANPAGAICAGTPVTFTAVPVNGGTTPSYQWKRNGINVGSNSATYTSNALANGDNITCSLTSSESCPSPSVVTSPAITMVVNPVLVPSVTITANPGTTTTPGTLVTFNANVSNGGSASTYQWRNNNINIAGATLSSYSSSSLANNDQISVVVHSNALCASPDTALSNVLQMNITTSVQQVFSFVDVSMYPNPTKGEFTIKGNTGIGDNSKELRLSIVTIQGQVILNEVIPVTRHSFKGNVVLPATMVSGTYLLRLTGENETQVFHISVTR